MRTLLNTNVAELRQLVAGGSHGDVSRIAGVDAVGVATGLSGIDDHAPSSEAVAAAIGNVKVGRVGKPDSVEREVVAATEDHDARATLVSARHP
jgi:hypothetical protein